MRPIANDRSSSGHHASIEHAKVVRLQHAELHGRGSGGSAVVPSLTAADVVRRSRGRQGAGRHAQVEHRDESV
jgi:hypothetical protein